MLGQLGEVCGELSPVVFAVNLTSAGMFILFVGDLIFFLFPPTDLSVPVMVVSQCGPSQLVHHTAVSHSLFKPRQSMSIMLLVLELSMNLRNVHNTKP